MEDNKVRNKFIDYDYLNSTYNDTNQALQNNKDYDKSFGDLRKNYKHLQADLEAEEYIRNLRDVGEYNRWALRLVQTWLLQFYNDQFWIEMGLAMLKYKHILDQENISLDICNNFIEGYYFNKENKIVLCANTLTNYEKKTKFHQAIKRHLVLMYDNVRSSNYDTKNCNHLACSEIRAAYLSGYCSESYSLMSAFTNQSRNKTRMNECVKSKANEHMMTYYDHCSNNSINYINSVWDKCIADRSPIRDFAREKSFL